MTMLVRILLWLMFRRNVYEVPAATFHDFDVLVDQLDAQCPICDRPADPGVEICWACGEVVTPTAAVR